MFKINNKDIRTTLFTFSGVLGNSHFLVFWVGRKWEWRHSGVFIVNFENISHPVLVFILLTLNLLIASWANFNA